MSLARGGVPDVAALKYRGCLTVLWGRVAGSMGGRNEHCASFGEFPAVKSRQPSLSICHHDSHTQPANSAVVSCVPPTRSLLQFRASGPLADERMSRAALSICYQSGAGRSGLRIAIHMAQLVIEHINTRPGSACCLPVGEDVHT